MFLGKTNYEEAKGGRRGVEGGRKRGRALWLSHWNCAYGIHGTCSLHSNKNVKRQTKMRSVLVLV